MIDTNVKSPDKACTLEQFISIGQTNDDMTYRNFSILSKENGIEFVDHNLLDDYLQELKNLCVMIPSSAITAEQRHKYKYAPDFLAFDVYGSTQLDFVVMLCNEVSTPEEFTMNGNLYLPMNSVLKAFLSMVYNGEYEYIQINRKDNGLKIY